MDDLEVKAEPMNEVSKLKQENKDLINDIENLKRLLLKKGIENQENLLIALMGSRQSKNGSGDSPPLFRFLQRVLNEFQTLVPYISSRKLPKDIENEARYEIIRKNILDSYHQNLRFDTKNVLKNYSIIKIQGEPQTDVFNFNGQQAEGN